MEQQLFLKIDSKLLAATVICNGNHNFELTFLEKGVYCHMLHRYNFFRDCGKDYFESQQNIATVFATSTKTIQRAVKKLENVGLIQIESTSRHNKYTVTDLQKLTYSTIKTVHENMKRETSFSELS